MRIDVSFPIKKAVIITREPFSALNSFYNMLVSFEHDYKCPLDEYIDSKVYLYFVKTMIKKFVEYHKFWDA